MLRVRVLVGLELISLLVWACGGKSIVRSGEDPSNGGTAPGGASNGGAKGAGVGDPDEAAPSLERLEGYCLSLCDRLNRECAGHIDLRQCTDLCFPPVTIAAQTASCARTAEDYLVCLNELDEVCDDFTTACKAGNDASLACIDDYCQAHPDNGNCGTFPD
jgi:hypothetical protein